MNGTPCGFAGEGPRGAARILAAEGLLTEQAALPTITSRREFTVHRSAGTGAGSAAGRDRARPRAAAGLVGTGALARGLQRRRPTTVHRPALPRAGRRPGPRRRRRRRRAGRARAGGPRRPVAGRQPRPGTALATHVDLRRRSHTSAAARTRGPRTNSPDRAPASRAPGTYPLWPQAVAARRPSGAPTSPYRPGPPPARAEG